MYSYEKKENMSSIKHILKNNIYSIKFIWQYSKCYVILSVFQSLFGGFFTPVELVLTSQLFDGLEKGCHFSEALVIIIIMIAVSFFYSLWNVLYSDIIVPQFLQKIHLKVQSAFFEKVRCIEISKYDDPEFYNEFVLTMENADSYATAALSNINSIIEQIFTITTILSIVIYIDPISMLIMFISAILALIVNKKLKIVDFQKQLDIIPLNRRKEYIDRIHKQADYAKELRLMDFGEKLIQDYNKNTAEYIALVKCYGKKTMLLEILRKINTRGVYLAIIAWTLYKLVVIKSVSLGGFTIIITSCNTFKQTLENFAIRITELSEQSMYMYKVRLFMEYNPIGYNGNLSVPKFESLEFKNVSFGYTLNKQVLHNINIKITHGEKIAIVGYNGAGKSTFIKLLMHLYEPTSGIIMYNGKNLMEYDIDSYHSNIGAVFQDYKIFAATIGENVMGDEFTDSDRGTVESALKFATFDCKLSALPNGINTILSREFDDDGVELSGGESQKIAIARIFAHPYDLVIMDEPSSALDPVAEYKLNKCISKYTEDKTVIFISHRLSTTRHVDRIYMFEDGQIIENGSHEELMKLDGKYAEMFKIQAEKYGYKI